MPGRYRLSEDPDSFGIIYWGGHHVGRLRGMGATPAASRDPDHAALLVLRLRDSAERELAPLRAARQHRRRRSSARVVLPRHRFGSKLMRAQLADLLVRLRLLGDA